jgi:hypothetical protein
VKVDRSRSRGGGAMIHGRGKGFGENHENRSVGLSYKIVV